MSKSYADVKVLIIDGQSHLKDHIQKILSLGFSQENIIYIEFSGGDLILETIKAGKQKAILKDKEIDLIKFDLIMSDCDLGRPGCDGMTVLHMYQKIADNIPFIMLTKGRTLLMGAKEWVTENGGSFVHLDGINLMPNEAGEGYLQKAINTQLSKPNPFTLKQLSVALADASSPPAP